MHRFKLGGLWMVMLGLLVFSGSAEAQRKKVESSFSDWTHHLALSMGGTSGQNDVGFTLGGNYELRLSDSGRLLGLGLFGEVAFTTPNRSMVGAQLFFYPVSDPVYGELRLGLGPAADFSLARTNLAFRTSAAWIFFLGQYTLSPNIAYNFVGNRSRNVFSRNGTFVFLLDFGITF